MKTRVITSICLLAIILPLAIMGGWFGVVLMLLFIVGGTIELLEVRPDTSWPRYFKIIVYLFVLVMLALPFIAHYQANGVWGLPTEFKVNVNVLFLAFYLLLLLGFEVVHKSISIADAFYIFTMTLLLVMAGQSFMVIRENIGFNALLYVLVVTYINDTFALLVGMKFGKHKLAPIISPKKTWEGAIGGVVIATILGTVSYLIFPWGGAAFNIWYIIPISFFLAIGGIFGDLIFSSIKRYFDMKDFGKIFPGHGGILDRIDSVVCTLILFMTIYTIITGGFLL